MPTPETYGLFSTPMTSMTSSMTPMTPAATAPGAPPDIEQAAQAMSDTLVNNPSFIKQFKISSGQQIYATFQKFANPFIKGNNYNSIFTKKELKDILSKAYSLTKFRTIEPPTAV